MDILATQICDDRDESTQNIASSSRRSAPTQVGVLHIGSNVYPLKEGINRIGRQSTCDIVIDNQTVSKKHAEIEAREATWVCDLHSSNRTKLNNFVLRPGRWYELKNGGVLEFGMARAVYELYRPPDESMIPETPAANHKHVSIPETPDSSLSNSSGVGNVSEIPATQTKEIKGALFRYPSLPLRSSIGSNRRSDAQDSSMDNSSLDVSTGVATKKKVGKRALAVKVTAEPAKENVPNDTRNTRNRKRNLSTVDANESSFGKKLKKDGNNDDADVSIGNKGPKRNVVTNTRQSTPIVNSTTRNDSPVNASSLSNSRSSSSELGSISPATRAELIPKNIDKFKRQTRRKTAANDQSTLSTSINKDNDTTQNARMRRANGTARSKVKSSVEEISSEIGVESQEVEMIMSGVLKKPSVNSSTESKKDTSTKPTKARNNRKRGNKSTDTDNTENSSSSSIVYESDNAQFEVPVSKPKRARNTSSVAKTLNVPDNETKRNSRSTIRLSKTNEKSIKEYIEETSSSNTSQSSEVSSVTPNRTRRSMSTSFSMSTSLKTVHRILFTGVSSNNYTKVISKLGASQVEDTKKCTVLVTDKVRRTLKFLCALAQSVPIVSIDWLVDSGKANEYMPLENYTLNDPETERQYKFNLRESLEKAKNHKLLEGYTVILTPNVAPPPLPELKSIITVCGGKPLIRPPQSWPQNSVIVTREGDIANAKKFLAKAPKTVTIQSIEFILTSILRQELNFSEFKLT